MPPLLASLFAFAAYTLAIILLTGRTFEWNETRELFYLGNRRVGFWKTLFTFCATWMSAASVVGFTMWMMQDGYVAFTSSVQGWLLGLVPMPILVLRLRRIRTLSVPEWLHVTYGCEALRYLGAASLIFAYIFYLVIQFRAFGAITAHMLQIRAGFTAAAMVYLFVLYTTFGGYPSVVRSDSLNMCLILAGVTLAAAGAVVRYGSPLEAHRIIETVRPQMLGIHMSSFRDGLTTFSLAMAWALGVAANPQYGTRFMSTRRAGDAMKVVCATPFVVGYIYLCLSCLALLCGAFTPTAAASMETAAFARFFDGALPLWSSLPLFVAVLAASVSTSNSELLIAACSFCYDILPSGRKKLTPLDEDAFLLKNRAVIVAIATISLVLSQMPLTEILGLGRMSWTVVAICFLFPLYMPARFIIPGRSVFFIIASAMVMHGVLCVLTSVTPEISMLVALMYEAAAWAVCRCVCPANVPSREAAK